MSQDSKIQSRFTISVHSAGLICNTARRYSIFNSVHTNDLFVTGKQVTKHRKYFVYSIPFHNLELWPLTQQITFSVEEQTVAKLSHFIIRPFSVRIFTIVPWDCPQPEGFSTYCSILVRKRPLGGRYYCSVFCLQWILRNMLLPTPVFPIRFCSRARFAFEKYPRVH